MGITREEAVDCISRAEVIDIVENVTEEWLKGDIGFMYPSLIKKIKGLPPVTLQPCEDAISRQALLNATVNKNSIWNKITDSKGDNLEAIISKLPPVTPQPRKGHWIFDGDCLICSKCKKAYSFSGSNFCPNCGADMREVKNGL